MAISRTSLAMALGGGGAAIDIYKPDVTWILNGCPSPRPESIDELVTAAVLVVVAVFFHWLVNKGVISAVTLSAGEETVSATSSSGTVSGTTTLANQAVSLLAKIVPTKTPPSP